MSELTCIEAEITFITKAEGGRETMPILSDCIYRPHIVVGNPNQKQAVVVGNEIQENYLGVAFLSSPNDVEFNKSFLAQLVLMFYPHPTYDSLIPNTSFTIREGVKIVGYGKVKKIFACKLSDASLKLN